MNSEMIALVCYLIAFPRIVSGLIHIDSHVLECDGIDGNVSTSYIHENSGNSLCNVTVQIFKTVTKALLYFTFRLATDKNDRDYKFELVKTVIDLGKFLNGTQGNPLLRNYIETLQKGSDFKLKFPLPPVSRNYPEKKLKV